MIDPKGFASLSPRLLARKGGAKPAMRPQVQPLTEFPQAAPHPAPEDPGRNDMGDVSDEHSRAADVVPITDAVNGTDAVLSARRKPQGPATPEVVVRRDKLAREIARAGRNGADLRPAATKRAAFTLRIDAERHRQLRLACKAQNRSAQSLLTEALDQLLAQLPETRPAATQARSRN